MVVGTLFRYGIPLSFVYCTIYQQDVWREGDEKLVAEQKRVWRDFFGLVDDGYRKTRSVLNLTSESETNAPESRLVAKFDSIDMRGCYNAKVASVINSVDKLVTNPKAVACKIYRKVQPYISSSGTEAKTEKS